MYQLLEVELPVKIEYDYTPGVPGNFNNPRESDQIEITNIYFYGKLLSNNQEDKFIEDYGKQELERLLIQLSQEDIESKNVIDQLI